MSFLDPSKTKHNFGLSRGLTFSWWIKGGEEVKRINMTSHGMKNIELFTFEGIPGPFCECGGFSPSQRLIEFKADRVGISR